MFSKIKTKARFFIHASIALSRGSLASTARLIDDTNPRSWEFSSFSQNGEDGIIDYLCRKIKNPNKYFIEIGSAEGIECNSSYLAFVQKFSGLMIDGNKKHVEFAQHIQHNLGVEYYSTYFYLHNVQLIKDWALYNNPDMFSWDTDGNDYYFVKKVFELGFRPKIFVVEYNSAFGPDKELTIEYKDSFNYLDAHPSGIYFGCSIALWKKLFASHNYTFVTVDSNGVNGFFIDSSQFDNNFVQNLKGVHFIENFYQLKKFKKPWEQQFDMIKNMPLFTE
jgi:hypothetical protein